MPIYATGSKTPMLENKTPYFGLLHSLIYREQLGLNVICQFNDYLIVNDQAKQNSRQYREYILDNCHTIMTSIIIIFTAVSCVFCNNNLVNPGE